MRKLINERYDRHYALNKDLIFRIALNYVNVREEAEDVMQEVFLKFYINMDNIEDDLVKSWLVVTTRHTAIDRLRRQKTHPEEPLSYQLPDPADNSMGDIIDKMARKDLSRCILKDLYRQNTEWFELLKLDCFCCTTHEDIARMKNISIEALRSKLYRAKQYIRNSFGQRYRDLS